MLEHFHRTPEIEAMVQEAEYALAIGIKIADSAAMPRYKDTDEFSAADKKRSGK